MKKAIQLIGEAMERPEEWALLEHRLVHRESGISFWISGGYLAFHSDGLTLGPINQWRLWRKSIALRQAITAAKLSGQSTILNTETIPDRGEWLQ